MRSREEIKQIVTERLRREFPHDTVDVTDGYQQNIHVIVVSRRFDEMRERDKQDLLWGLIDDTDLATEEKGLISLLLPASPEALR
jgi:acid stress-induced BolA-like protein IbaG/YrbA